MHIYSTNITENQNGAAVEISLGDAPIADDAHEYLAFSVLVQYDKSDLPSLEEIKKEAFAKVRSIAAAQASAAEKLIDDKR